MPYGSLLTGTAISPINRAMTKTTMVVRAGYHLRHILATASTSLVPKPLGTTGALYETRYCTSYTRLWCSSFSTEAQKPSPAPRRRSTTINFRGLPPDVDKEEVKGFFSQCGEVVEVRVSLYTVTVASGSVKFASQKSVDKALAFNEKDVLGRPMSINALFELPDTIAVGPFPLGIDDEQVKAFFSSCGEVTDTKIHSSLGGQQEGKSYGFVRFASSASASEALRLHRRPFVGRRMNVSRAIQAAEDVSIWDNYAETDGWTTRTVNISNIPPQVNDDQLAAEFQDCGEIFLARVWRVLSTGNSLGFGFIHFKSPESAAKALEATKSIAGQPLSVTRVSPIRPSALDYASGPVEHQPTKSIFIGRLTDAVDRMQLRREFARFGKVTGVRVVRDRDWGKSRGCAYVNFDSPDAVERVMQLASSIKIDGFSVHVERNYSLPKSKRAVTSSPGIDAPDPYESYRNTGSWEDDY